MSCVFSRFNGILQLARQLLVPLNIIYLIIIAIVIFSLTLCFILFSIALKNRYRPFYFASFLYIHILFFLFQQLLRYFIFYSFTIAFRYFLFRAFCYRIEKRQQKRAQQRKDVVRVCINVKQRKKRDYYRYHNNQGEEESEKRGLLSLSK